MEVKKIIKEYEKELIEIRRKLHSSPELGYEEYETSDFIYNYLKDLGFDEVNKICKTGVVGLIKGKKEGKTLMLRADIDALPVFEETDIEYKSKIEGKMHACGHDAHAAMLLIAAKVLVKYRDDINGNIKFLFQPNEESSAALDIIEAKVLENPHVDVASAIHIWSQLDSGKIGISNGAVMAALEEFVITIHGKGGHTGSPHVSIDPIIASANIITSVQQIQTRELDPREATVIMFGKVEAGTACNIIPEKATLEGTIRFLYKDEDAGREKLKELFDRIVKGVCIASNTKYEIEYKNGNPAVINDSSMVTLARESAKKTVSDENNVVEYSYIAGEDFAEFSKVVPSVFYFIGSKNEKKNTHYPHHHPKFNIDEDVLKYGVEMHVRMALDYLSK